MPNFSGKWNLNGQLAGIKQGTWTGITYTVDTPILTSWGSGYQGRTGQNDTVSRSSPTQIGALTNWSTVEAGGVQAFAISSEGELYAWGANSYGQLGQNDTIGQSSPVQIGALTNWSKVATSKQGTFGAHTSAIKTDGTLWVWGRGNYRGCLGTGTVNVSSPIQLTSASNWTEISRGGVQGAAINSSNELYVWGSDVSGRQGQNTNLVDNSSPTQVGAAVWSKVSVGGGHMHAIRTNGTLWGWGYNSVGQLGDNTTIHKSSPVQIGALTNWASLGYGQFSTFAIKTDGTLWAWGNNGSGRLGISSTLNRSSPVQVGALTNWASVQGGNSADVAALTVDDELYVWGSNSGGQLGLNDQGINRSSPVQVGVGTWSDVSSGNNFKLGIFNESTTKRTGMS